MGYSLAIMRMRIPDAGGSAAHEVKGPEDKPANVKSLYELDEVLAKREDLDGKRITVVGAVMIRAGQPFLVPDDDVALLKDSPGEGRYLLTLPGWRFRSMQYVAPGIAVTGRFGKLDDNVGYDCLSPIDSISWDLPPRGRKHDSIIDDEEAETIEIESDSRK